MYVSNLLILNTDHNETHHVVPPNSPARTILGTLVLGGFRTLDYELHTPNRPDTRRMNASCGSVVFGSIEYAFQK